MEMEDNKIQYKVRLSTNYAGKIEHPYTEKEPWPIQLITFKKLTQNRP